MSHTSKQNDIKDLNIRSMLYLIALVENNYVVTNAALDMKALDGSVSHQMKRIERSFDFDFFIWGKRKPHHVNQHILGLTNRGRLFYKSVKWFINTTLITSELLGIEEL